MRDHPIIEEIERYGYPLESPFSVHIEGSDAEREDEEKNKPVLQHEV